MQRLGMMDTRIQYLPMQHEPRIEEFLVYPIQLTELVRRTVEEVESFKQECVDVNRRVETLGTLLRQAARFSSTNPAGLYESPTKRIMAEVEKTLEKACALVKKCKRSGMLRRVITITKPSDFKKLDQHLENSIVDVRWLLNISASGDDRPYFTGLPPIASTDPILAMVWEYVSLVHVGTPDEREQGASYLADLAKDGRNGKIIVEEGGVQPLLRLLREGTVAGQEEAARALGCLAATPERVGKMRMEGAISVFVQILGHGSMKVQAMTAWALSEFCDKDVESQNECAAAGGIRLVVFLLAHDTIEDLSKMTKAVSIHTVVQSTMAQPKAGSVGNSDQQSDGVMVLKPTDQKAYNSAAKPKGVPVELRSFTDTWVNPAENSRRNSFPSSLRTMSRNSRDNEDPETKAKLKAEAARALWKLAKGNVKNSESITNTRALLCFAKLIETGEGDVQFNSVMAVMEIAAAAERDAALRRAVFRTDFPPAKAVVEQLLRVIEAGEPELQEPCLRAIGCLSRIFPAKANIITPLTKALNVRDSRVVAEAATALYKFADPENYLHVEHSRTILEAKGAKYLVPLLTCLDLYTQEEALRLLCCLSVNVPDHEALAQAMALTALENMTRSQVVAQNLDLRNAVADAIAKLELYQASVHRHNSSVAPYVS